VRAEIVVVRQGIAGEAVTLPAEGRFFVGRGTECQLRFDDKGISNIHCQFERRGETWFVADEESRNGTFLNGKRIAAASLAQGDIVVLGETALLFRQRAGDDHGSSDTQAVFYKNEWCAGPEDLMEGEGAPVGGAGRWDRAVPAEAWRTVFTALAEGMPADADFPSAAQVALVVLARVTGAERGLVALYRGPGEGWQVVATVPQGNDACGVVASEAILAKAMELRVAILTEDALADARLTAQEGAKSGARAAICVPFQAFDGRSAVLYFDSPTESTPFAREHVRIARAACRLLSVCPGVKEI